MPVNYPQMDECIYPKRKSHPEEEWLYVISTPWQKALYPLAVNRCTCDECQSVQEIRKKVQILFPPSQPKSKEGVVQAVGVLVLGNKVLLQQSPYGRVDCTGRL
mgnify:FL=1